MDERKGMLAYPHYLVKWSVVKVTENPTGQKFGGIFFAVFLELLSLFGFGWSFVSPHSRFNITTTIFYALQVIFKLIIVHIK